MGSYVSLMRTLSFSPIALAFEHETPVLFLNNVPLKCILELSNSDKNVHTCTVFAISRVWWVARADVGAVGVQAGGVLITV